ncbi:MAG: aldo/keto reductase [bacterium]
MNYRVLGRTELKVSEISFGALKISCREGWKGCRPLDEPLAKEAIHKALELGINHFDTAESYGESERILGETIKENGTKNVILSTKVWSGLEEKIQKALENSLKKLKVNYIDIYNIHGLERAETALPVFKKLKEQGKIGYIAISGWYGSEELIKKYMHTGDIDIIQVAYNLAFTEMKPVMDLAEQLNIGIQVMSPLNSGILTGRQDLVENFRPYGIKSLEQACIKFILQSNEKAVPIPGTKRSERIAHYCEITSDNPIPVQMFDELVKTIQGIAELRREP